MPLPSHAFVFSVIPDPIGDPGSFCSPLRTGTFSEEGKVGRERPLSPRDRMARSSKTKKWSCRAKRGIGFQRISKHLTSCVPFPVSSCVPVWDRPLGCLYPPSLHGAIRGENREQKSRAFNAQHEERLFKARWLTLGTSGIQAKPPPDTARAVAAWGPGRVENADVDGQRNSKGKAVSDSDGFTPEGCPTDVVWSH